MLQGISIRISAIFKAVGTIEGVIENMIFKMLK
jgi:hypothetical protein